MERTPNKESAHKIDPGKENSASAPAGIRTRNLSMTSPALYQQAIAAPGAINDIARIIPTTVYFISEVILSVTAEVRGWGLGNGVVLGVGIRERDGHISFSSTLLTFWLLYSSRKRHGM